MSNETITIYSAIDLGHKGVILKASKDAYLNCKFWKATEDEAIKFSQVYRGPVQYEAFRTIALLNNQSLSHQNIQSLHHTTVWLLTSNDTVPQSLFVMLAWIYLDIFYCLNQLWVDIHNDSSYPNEHLIEDVVSWAAGKNLIPDEQTRALEKEILAVRRCIFSNKDVEDSLRIKTVQAFINSNNYIFYSDAVELLSLKENMLPALDIAISTGTIIACFSKDKNASYLHIESLLKWLMTHNHFPQQWLQAFKKLKIKSLDELASPTPQTFTLDQLKIFLQKYHSGNEDINYHLNTGVYRVYLYIRKGMVCTYLENKQPIQMDNPTYSIRYLNLERLLPFSTDPYHIAKNLLDGVTINASQCNSFIFLDSTREEYAQGLQRILSLRAEGSSENHYQLNYQDLRFVTNEVKQGLKKHLPLTSGKSRQKIATESGVISGKVRREDIEEHWLSIKPQVLEIAKSFNKAYINKIAEIAIKRGITTKSPRTIGRFIAADPSFAPYLKKNSHPID